MGSHAAAGVFGPSIIPPVRPTQAKLVPELRKFVATAAENKKLKGRLTELKAGLRIAQEQAASASQTHQAAAQELQGVLAAQQEAERRCAAAERSCSEVEGQAAALKSERQEARQQCAAAEQVSRAHGRHSALRAGNACDAPAAVMLAAEP